MLLITAAIMLVVSCSDDPQSPIEKDDEIPWPAMTDRDDVIKTVVLCYENPKDGSSDSKYNALLHSLYFFKFDESDVDPGGSPIFTRAEDIMSTEWLFTVTTILELTITETGAWHEYPEIEGEPCENCWETTRQYFVRAQFEGEGTIYHSSPERVFVTIIAAPDESDSSKWVLRAMFDLKI
jgi:hypothetical protein